MTVYIPADVSGMAHGYALAGAPGPLRDISRLPQIEGQLDIYSDHAPG